MKTIQAARGRGRGAAGVARSDTMTVPSFYIGACHTMGVETDGRRFELPAHHLVTHAVILGTTGSGKTGLITVLVEEALAHQIPVLMIDVKGDLPNLALRLPSFAPEPLVPWVQAAIASGAATGATESARQAAALRQQGLNAWGIDDPALSAFYAGHHIRVITPGCTAGEPLHLLSSLELPSRRWQTDPEAAREALGAAVSLVLRLIGREADPAKSREHALLTIMAERRLSAGNPSPLGALVEDVLCPPIDRIGALALDDYLSKSERRSLAAGLNTLLVSPNFSTWRQGAPIDVADWLAPRSGRASGVIVSVAHLDEEERRLVLGVLLEEILAFVRTLPGTGSLRALLVFDEIYGFMPPHPANPPTKRPMVTLMKQGRAFGIGVVVATQNTMDLDYRALGNAGLWCTGRLQTEADRDRVLRGITADGVAAKPAELGDVIGRLCPRWFLLRDSHLEPEVLLVQPRWAMTYMRGPMTRCEIKRAREAFGSAAGGFPAGSTNLAAHSELSSRLPALRGAFTT